ncbi:MAG TPA: TadE/TadG family type IV pilus assembly protein [Gemmataceae bacterium]|jgi:Flp pilus assembly protein TadG|nr:TadE/TadG family type IV pilus assembly protein [Gemmataceae bacterium]
MKRIANLPVPASDTLARRPQTRRRGAAAAEFAVVAPLIALLMLGAIEFGRAVQLRAVLQDAARKACRTGVKPGNNSATITTEVNNILQDNGMKPSDATITILVNGVAVDASTAQRNDVISVKVGIPFNKVTWSNPLFLTNTLIESETVAMMRQG